MAFSQFILTHLFFESLQKLKERGDNQHANLYTGWTRTRGQCMVKAGISIPRWLRRNRTGFFYHFYVELMCSLSAGASLNTWKHKTNCWGAALIHSNYSPFAICSYKVIKSSGKKKEKERSQSADKFGVWSGLIRMCTLCWNQPIFYSTWTDL